MRHKPRTFRPLASWLPGGGSYSFGDVAWLGAMLVVWALSEAKAVQSIASGLVVLGALGHSWQHGWAWRQRWALVLVIPFGLSLLAAPVTSSWALWGQDIWRKLPFLGLGLSLALLPPFQVAAYRLIFGGFVVIQSLVAWLSIGRFAWHYEATMGALSRNTEIDIIGSISHIYFGVLLALSAGLGLWLATQKGQGRWLMLGLGLANVLALHILTSRTGLLAFYAAGLGTGLVLAYRRRAWRLALGLIGLFGVGGVGSYYTIPSFRMRVEVTRWDLQGYVYQDRDLAHHSATLRLLAWETAARHIRPWWGTGIADVEADLQAAYAARALPVPREALPTNPHNQYLEYGMAFGLPGILALLVLLLLPGRLGPRPPTLMTVFFTILMLSAMLTESLLERQAGIYTLIFFVALLPGYQVALRAEVIPNA